MLANSNYVFLRIFALVETVTSGNYPLWMDYRAAAAVAVVEAYLNLPGPGIRLRFTTAYYSFVANICASGEAFTTWWNI